jgi:hypothetical protein
MQDSSTALSSPLKDRPRAPRSLKQYRKEEEKKYRKKMEEIKIEEVTPVLEPKIYPMGSVEITMPQVTCGCQDESCICKVLNRKFDYVTLQMILGLN